MKEILSKEEVDSIYKEIRLSPEYKKHADLYAAYVRKGQYTKSMYEAGLMKRFEVETFEKVAKERINIWKEVQKKIDAMSNEDKHTMNILSNALRMMSDVVEVFIRETNSILKKYELNNMQEYDKLEQASQEAYKCVRRFETYTQDEKVTNLFGDGCDNLYKLIFNKASSFVNKVKKHEESMKKKAKLKSE